jgi:hypothetical protein
LGVIWEIQYIQGAPLTIDGRMKTRTAQLTAIAGIAIVAAILVSPWVIAATSTASTSTTSTNSTGASTSNSISTQNHTACWQGPGFGRGFGRPNLPGPPDRSFGLPNTANLTVGQTITITSSQGSFFVVGTPSDNGTASGTITFTVTSKLAEGYTLSITSGSLVVGGTTYTVSSGTAQTGRSADVISGQGTTSPTGTFLLQGLARGSFAGTTGQLNIDIEAGSTEYVVNLTGMVQS